MKSVRPSHRWVTVSKSFAAGVSLEPVTSSIYPVQVLVGFSLSAGGTTFREDSQDSTEQTSDADLHHAHRHRGQDNFHRLITEEL